MKENYEAIRKTVYISDELVKRAEILYGEAEVNSFSGFVSKAIDAYISKLVADKYGSALGEEIRKAIRNELGVINSRLSKGLYRYAIEIDILAQLLADACEYTPEEFRRIRVEANKQIAKMRGSIDLNAIFCSEEEEHDYE